MKKVSIIIPIYNGEKYIHECLQSVCNQNYSNIEILIINDGSTDTSLQHCQSWQKKDSRISIYNNENHGVSYSRNFGIEKCEGEYIAFIDADDIVAGDYIALLVDMIERNPCYDLSVVKLSAFSNIPKPCYDGEEKLLSTSQAEYAVHTYIGGFAWGRLYRVNILKENHIKFKEDIAVCEDLLFNTEYIKYCRGVIYNTGAKYFYRQHTQSAFHNPYNLRWFDCIKVYQRILEGYQGGESNLKIVIYNYFKILYGAKYRAKILKRKDLINNVKKETKKYRQYKKLFSIRQRINLLILRYFYPIVVFYRKHRKEK